MISNLTPLPAHRAGIGTSPGSTSPACSVLPAPGPPPAPQPAAAPAKASWTILPEVGTTTFPATWPNPLSALPASPAKDPAPSRPTPIADMPSNRPSPATPPPTPEFTAPTPATPPAPTPEPIADFTDADLRDAFAPLVQDAVLNALSQQDSTTSGGSCADLEPMLRATIRRALAEYTPASKPFQPPGAFDRLVWQMQALFTSRSYDNVLFAKTRRFQVEEAFLLDAKTLALVSFASCDPARHASARRVATTVHRLAVQIHDDQGNTRSHFTTSGKQNVIARQGTHTILATIVRGNPGEYVLDDLDFVLRRIENRFREPLQQEGSDLLRPIQPFLEDCLLIQSPATSAN